MLNRIPCNLILLLFFAFLGAQNARAVDMPIPAQPELPAKSYLLMDAHSGKLLADFNGELQLAHASLTKIMTVYVVFRELTNGNIKLDDMVTISEKAWRTGGSRMFIEVNTPVSVEDLLKGVIIQSGNDASVALAEHVAGDESTFAALMNQHAERLEMVNTHFVNSDGLPKKDHYTSAHDLAILTKALIKDFPEYYQWHAEKEFTYNGITQHNRNKLLYRNPSVDGVKTGHTEEAGFCLVASAKRDDMRLISVVMGANSDNSRANANQALLNYGFRFFETHRLYEANKPLTETRIWKGEVSKVPLGVTDDLFVTIPRRQYNNLKASMEVESTITAPVKQGQTVGNVNVALGEEVITQRPLVALKSVAEGGIFQRLYDEALLLIQ
ncbi:MAG: D-alanyl-D-alanine carboxypeptidase family protein [Pseudomonadota bacterium]